MSDDPPRRDVKTIHEAIKVAQPGDTIHLQPIVYRDYAGFYGKKGAPGKPITLDGHGATLEGSDPIDPAQWKEVSFSLRPKQFGTFLNPSYHAFGFTAGLPSARRAGSISRNNSGAGPPPNCFQ